MWLPTKVCGFSTKCSMAPSSPWTTTPYLDGSATLVTKMVPSAPWDLWKASSSLSGYSQVTSELNTKNGSPSLRCSLASARGPAVPMGSVSWLQVILTPTSAAMASRASLITSGW